MTDEVPLGAQDRSAGRRRVRRRSRHSSNRAYNATRWLVSATVVGSVLAVGSVHVHVALAAALAAIVAAVVAARADDSRTGLPLPAILLTALAGYTALQATPLPRALVGFVAARNADLWDRTTERVEGHVSNWLRISLDPGATWVEAAKWLSYAALFFAAAVVGARYGARWGARLAFVSALATAAVTIVHGLIGATKLYGFYDPTFVPSRWNVSPLLNGNNLASYLNFGALCGLGLVLTHAPGLRRWMTALGVAGLFAVSVLCGSRGAALTLPLGLLVLALFLRRMSVGSRQMALPASSRWFLIGTVGGGIALALLGARSGWGDLLDKSYDKLRLLQWSKPMVTDHFWFGIGRGAFEGAFHAYGDPERNIVYAYAENLPVQWLADWGVPAGGLGLLALAWTLRPRQLGAGETPVGSTIFAAAVALFAHNLFDLGLELPSISLLAAATLGAAYGEHATQRSRAKTDELPERPHRLVRPLAFAAAGAAALVPALAWGRSSAVSERDQLQKWHAELDVRDAARTNEFRTALVRAIQRHPADPYFPRLMALLAWRKREESVMKWIALALERDMNSGRTHYLLANVLHAKGARSQALLELKLAVANDPSLTVEAAGLALQWGKSDDEIVRAAPIGREGVTMLFRMASFLKRERIETRHRLLSEALARSPQYSLAREMIAIDLLRELAPKSGTKICTADRRDACIRTIDSQIAALRAQGQQTSTADELQARLLVIQGRPADGHRLLSASCGRYSDSVDCLRTLVEVTAETNDATRLEAAAMELMGKACPPSSRCAQTGVWLGDFFSRRNDWHHALTFYRRAAQEEPNENTLNRLATAASKARRHAEAVEVLQRVSRLKGSDAKLRERIEHERSQALREMLAPR